MTASVVTLGETMGLFRAASIGSLEHVSQLELHIGGAESNVAIGVVRLGGSATWLGRVGDDAIGRRVLRELRAEGVEVHATVDGDAPTGVMVKETPYAGSTRVTYYRRGSAGSRLSFGDLDVAAIATAGVLHVTGISLAISESAATTVYAAIDVALEAKVPISFDINHRASLWGDRDPGPTYRRVAELCDVVFAGEDEAALVVGPGEPDQLARRLADLGPSQAIVKLGEEGCVASIDGELLREAANVIQAVDTVGAGDAFVAGYLVAALDGNSPAARLQQGNRCGAFACLGPGDWESLPRASDLARLDSADPVRR